MEIFTPPQVKEKRPPGRQPKHSQEFMIMVARKCIDEGMTYREASTIFGVSHGSVYQFIQKYKHDKFKTKRNARTSKYKKEVEEYRHTAQVKELKHEIAELYLENLMLKKALKHSLSASKRNKSLKTLFQRKNLKLK
ncbi:MAG: helix-turn-helix domain-containing protein [Bdellovibrionota bacterium]